MKPRTILKDVVNADIFNITLRHCFQKPYKTQGLNFKVRVKMVPHFI